MVSREVIPGGFHGDAWPNGIKAILGAGVMHTHLGDLSLPLGAALYPRIWSKPDRTEFKIVGQAAEGGGTLVWEAGQWRRDPRTSHGISGHIFDRDGVLHIIEPAPDQTSQGYRYVADDGSLVLGDATYGNAALRISEYTTLGDLTVGQGWQGGVLAIRGTDRRILEPGDTRFVRFMRDGDQLAVTCSKFAEKCVVIHQLTVNDLTTFPREEDQDEPPAPVPPAPQITILSYFPSQGPAPLRVKAIRGLSGGQAARIFWRARKKGAASWVIVANNPATDPDHHYLFKTPGTYEIGCDVTAPDRPTVVVDGTSKARVVTVA